jgi:acetolactate synthase-1/2/3 large subunit
VLHELPDAVFVGDSTQPVYTGNLTFNPERPRRWFNSSTGYGTLGYALPAAIGAWLGGNLEGGARPPVVCLIGDGGLQFTLPELASAVEARTPVIVLLWNNQGYEEIKKYMVNRAIEPVGVDIYTRISSAWPRPWAAPPKRSARLSNCAARCVRRLTAKARP